MPSEAYYTLLINGDRFFCYKYATNANQYIQIEDLPEYEAMLTGECVAVVDNGSLNTEGNTEIFSIGFVTYWKASWTDKNGKMRLDRHPLICICVEHDDEKTFHHALQLLVDKDAVSDGKTIRFYHNGRIAVGKMGSGKKSELCDMVAKRYPKILDGEKYYLGSITADYLLRLDEPDVIDLIINLISYFIVRDEFREIVKNRT
ncbi:hypothetical protein HW273_10910 [Oribacterium sp. oral taxon 102]|uniref:hypothetical protein n=1 Tax=Oribacterium sp. oral taxon 102 TaxID=671214 RepID=UPI0015C0D1B7|nr:hypothetical protein [Oribacterium sp. oral taxon 102]NWO22389.1 hypothetical protein [Oribacterium sp. oral taxon 102]